MSHEESKKENAVEVKKVETSPAESKVETVDTKIDKKSTKMPNKTILIGAAVLLILLFIGLAAGGYYVWNQRNLQAMRQNAFFNQGPNGRQNGMMFQRGQNYTGSILSLSGSQFTLDIDNDGGQKILTVADSTTVNILKTVKKDDIIQKGNTVTIQTEEKDGKTIAKTVRKVEVPADQTARPSGAVRPSDVPQNGRPQGSPLFTIGTITDITSEGIVVTFRGTDTKTIVLADSTTYITTEKGSKSDLAVGKKVSTTIRNNQLIMITIE